MKRILAFSVVVGAIALLAGACASGGPAYQPAEPDPEGAPLHLRIEPDHNEWAVHTNRPVSVALFEIVPNRGVGLLYPDPSREEGRIGAGVTWLVTETGSVILRHRAAYLSPTGTGGLAGNQNQRVHEANAPITVVAFACECTLNLDTLAEPGGPREVLGVFAGLNVPTAVAGLKQEILPSTDVNWISARYQLVPGG
jgi:hypothetical protein